MSQPKKTNICRLFQNHLRWRNWLVARNNYAQRVMIPVKKLFWGKFLRMKDFAFWVAFIQMLHLKKPTSVAFFRNTYIDEIEWLRVTITLKVKWLRSKNVCIQMCIVDFVVTRLKDISLHSNVASQVSQHLSFFQEKI